MKCLEKDRTRRYGTASDLARDVERHLKDERVEACPPSTVYRAQQVGASGIAAPLRSQPDLSCSSCPVRL